MVTAAAVAKKAKVSTATVSRVVSGSPGVSEETRVRVLKAVEELGYVPNITAQMLVRGENGAAGRIGGDFGVIVSSGAIRYSHAFFTPVLEGLELEITRQERSIAFVRTFEELTSLYDLGSLKSALKGLIIVGCPSSFDVLKRLVDIGMDMVLVEFWYEGVDSVIFDRDSGMRQIVGHLMEKGHSDIGYIGGPDRMDSFRKAMRENGLAVRREWCDDYDGWTMEVGYVNGRRLLQPLLTAAERPTAFVAGSDDIAVGFIRVCKDLGLRLPEDLSVISFDDSPVATYLDPRLTTVGVNKTELGRIAVRRLMDRLTYGDVAATMTLCPVKLVVRESVIKV